MARARKLYFDVELTEASPSAVVSPTLTPDRDGGLLDAPPALDGNSAPDERQRRELTVWFQPYTVTVD